LKVFNLDHGGAEIFHVQIGPLHDPPGYCIAISGNGNMVALGHDSCYVWYLDSGGTRRLVLEQVVVPWTTCLAFSDDGERLVTGFVNGDLHEWLVNSGMEGREFLWPSDADDLEKRDVLTVVYETDDCIISGSQMRSGQTRYYIWSRSGTCTFSYRLPEEIHRNTSPFSSHWLIHSEGDNKGWQFYNLLTGELQFKRGPMPRGYAGVGRTELFTLNTISAVSSDGELAAFGLWLHVSIFIWDVHENIQLAELVGHTGSLTSVTFAGSHGKSKYSLVTTSLDGTVRLWDLDQLFKPKEDQHPMTSWRTCPNADGNVRSGGCSIQNGNGECLFWLPTSCPIRHPLNTLVIGRCAELDMTDFVYGKQWTKCRGSKGNDEPSEER
jgi:WD40 repeat protein